MGMGGPRRTGGRSGRGTKRYKTRDGCVCVGGGGGSVQCEGGGRDDIKTNNISLYLGVMKPQNLTTITALPTIVTVTRTPLGHIILRGVTVHLYPIPQGC